MNITSILELKRNLKDAYANSTVTSFESKMEQIFNDFIKDFSLEKFIGVIDLCPTKELKEKMMSNICSVCVLAEGDISKIKRYCNL